MVLASCKDLKASLFGVLGDLDRILNTLVFRWGFPRVWIRSDITDGEDTKLHTFPLKKSFKSELTLSVVLRRNYFKSEILFVLTITN